MLRGWSANVTVAGGDPRGRARRWRAASITLLLAVTACASGLTANTGVRVIGPPVTKLPTWSLIGSAGWFAIDGVGERGPTVTKLTNLVDASELLIYGRAPFALADADGDVLYHSWTWSRRSYEHLRDYPFGLDLGYPSIRLRTASGSDEALVTHAQTVAWRTDGALAYVQGGDYRTGAPFTGRIVVRASLKAPGVTWTPSTGAYTVVAWSGNRLLYQEAAQGVDGDGPLFVIDGPGRSTALTNDTVQVLAVAPDGRTVLVAEDSAAGSVLSVIDIRSGTVTWKRPAPLLLPGHATTQLNVLGNWLDATILLSGVVDQRAALVQLTANKHSTSIVAAKVIELPSVPFVIQAMRRGDVVVALTVRDPEGTGATAPQYELVVCEKGRCTEQLTGLSAAGKQLSLLNSFVPPLQTTGKEAMQ